MNCNCQPQQEFHLELYSNGITTNICSIKSRKSVKKVEFECLGCKQNSIDTILNILTRGVICSSCYNIQKQKQREEERNKLKSDIYEIIKNTDISVTKQEIKPIISQELGITENLCEILMNELPDEYYLNRKFDVDKYLTNLPIYQCEGCNEKLFMVKENSIKVWKDKQYCDKCWGEFYEERQELWNIVTKEYHTCFLCLKERQTISQRFHFDHKNMFDKGDSICVMINEGRNIKDIMNELSKCQYICIQCHEVVTDIETKYPFTKVKRCLTVKLNNEEISQEEYEKEVEKWKKIYENTINNIYDMIKQRQK